MIITIIITIKIIITRSNKKLTGCNAMQHFAGVDLIRANVTFMLLFSNKCDFPTSVTQQRIFPMFLLHLTFIQLLFALSHSHQPQGTQTSNILILAKHWKGNLQTTFFWYQKVHFRTYIMFMIHLSLREGGLLSCVVSFLTQKRLIGTGGGAILDFGLRTIFQIWNSSLAPRRQKVMEERNYEIPSAKKCLLVCWSIIGGKKKGRLIWESGQFWVVEVFPAFLLIALFFNGLVREASSLSVMFFTDYFPPCNRLTFGAKHCQHWTGKC